MKTILEAQLLSVQLTKVDRNTYAKAFIAQAPDGIGEALASVMQIGIAEENADAVFNYVNSQGIQFGDTVRLHVKAVRGAQNAIRNVIESIEVINVPRQQPTKEQAKAAG